MKSKWLLAPFAVAVVGTIAFLELRIAAQDRAIDILRRQVASDATAPQTKRPAIGVSDPAAHALPAPEPASVRTALPIENADPDPKSKPTTVDPATSLVDPEDARARFAMVLEKEPIDAGWARERSHLIAARVDAVLPKGSTMGPIECRSRLCRFETTHDDLQAILAFTDGAFEKGETKLGTGGSFTSATGTDSRGRTILVTYIARDGENLPDVLSM